MRVSKMTVYRLVHNGELPAVRVGRSFPACTPRRRPTSFGDVHSTPDSGRSATAGVFVRQSWPVEGNQVS